MSTLEKSIIEEGPLTTEPKDSLAKKTLECRRRKHQSVQTLSKEEIKKDLQNHNIERAEQKIIPEYDGVIESVSKKEHKEELKKSLTKLKQNNPQLYNSVYEKTRSERAGRKTARNQNIKTGIASLTLALPFALDMFQGQFSVWTEYKFVLLMLSALWVGYLKRVSIHYKLTTLILVICLNINPYVTEVFKAGYRKFAIEAGMILFFFLVVEALSTIVPVLMQPRTQKRREVRQRSGLTKFALVAFVLLLAALSLYIIENRAYFSYEARWMIYNLKKHI